MGDVPKMTGRVRAQAETGEWPQWAPPASDLHPLVGSRGGAGMAEACLTAGKADSEKELSFPSSDLLLLARGGLNSPSVLRRPGHHAPNTPLLLPDPASGSHPCTLSRSMC